MVYFYHRIMRLLWRATAATSAVAAVLFCAQLGIGWYITVDPLESVGVGFGKLFQPAKGFD